MLRHFTRLRFGYPDDYRPPTDKPGSWKVYVICSPDNPGDNEAKKDVWAMEEADRIDARMSFVGFNNRTNLGKPLADIYDEKQLHEAHSYKANPHDQTAKKIFRIWGSGKIRIYFIYLLDKKILILKTAPKRTDRLKKGDKLELENLAKSAFDCIEKHGFTEV